MGRRDFEAEVERAWMINDFVKGLTLRRADGEPFRAHPGQFFMLHVERDGKRMNRSYSVANRIDASRSTELVEWCVALVEGGLGSEVLGAAKAGDRLVLTGPHGRFVIRDTPRRLVLVATGTGVAPYRSMLHDLSGLTESGTRVDLVMGARTQDDLLYDDEFLDFAAAHPGFKYHRALSRKQNDGGWEGEFQYLGRVQVVLDALDYDLDTVFYLCGNPGMVDEVRDRLMAEGFARQSIRTEAYVSPPDLEKGGQA